MHNVLQKDMYNKTNIQKEQSVKSLNTLIPLLKQSDLCKFLPKVWIPSYYLFLLCRL